MVPFFLPRPEFIGKLPVSEQDREKIAHLNAEKLFTL
jgi:predicted TIM-barrel fold metal-dependent hydrolase